jgi:hypothetical protein
MLNGYSILAPVGGIGAGWLRTTMKCGRTCEGQYGSEEPMDLAPNAVRPVNASARGQPAYSMVIGVTNASPPGDGNGEVVFLPSIRDTEDVKTTTTEFILRNGFPNIKPTLDFRHRNQPRWSKH